MKTIQDDINNWLLHEADLIAGHAFQMEDFACLPVWPKAMADKRGESPRGFLVTHGKKIIYMDAHAPEAEPMLHTWSKCYLTELLEGEPTMPAEYWYG